MAIKRLNLSELESTCKDIFYTYMSSSSTYYTQGNTVNCTSEYPTPAHMLFEEHMEVLKENEDRIKMYEKVLTNSSTDMETTDLLHSSLSILKEERELLRNMCLKTQKERRESLHTTYYASSIVRIPLNRKINSYYDDLILEVVFYDDVTTFKGKFYDYNCLETSETRKEFIKRNTEITHMGLVVKNTYKKDSAVIVFLGKKNNKAQSGYNMNTEILDQEYADFTSLSLDDLDRIRNNDLRQFFQARIDLDKEDMELMATKNVRGDVYKIFKKGNERVDLYIRYVCPSTGRIYFNNLNLHNLKLSKYFKEGDYTSYIDSWWNITHLGASVEGKPVISC